VISFFLIPTEMVTPKLLRHRLKHKVVATWYLSERLCKPTQCKTELNFSCSTSTGNFWNITRLSGEPKDKLAARRFHKTRSGNDSSDGMFELFPRWEKCIDMLVDCAEQRHLKSKNYIQLKL
jgi:hypothetical protein